MVGILGELPTTLRNLEKSRTVFEYLNENFPTNPSAGWALIFLVILYTMALPVMPFWPSETFLLNSSIRRHQKNRESERERENEIVAESTQRPSQINFTVIFCVNCLGAKTDLFWEYVNQILLKFVKNSSFKAVKALKITFTQKSKSKTP